MLPAFSNRMIQTKIAYWRAACICYIVADSDPYNFPVSGSRSVPYPYPTLMSTTKISGKENLTTYASWLGPGGPNGKENQVKMYTKYRFRYITPLWNSKDLDPDQIVGSRYVSKWKVGSGPVSKWSGSATLLISHLGGASTDVINGENKRRKIEKRENRKEIK